jgi:(2R)-3-sulfolactate dehydrogenase (NADP+)
MTQLLSLPDVQALACDCLTRAGVPDAAARTVASEIAAAEAAGERHHGMEALLRDIRLLRYGRIDASALPTKTRPRAGLLSIDAAHGFAAAALSDVAGDLFDAARSHGIAMARLDRASAPGAMIRAVEPFAALGLIAVAFANEGPGRIAHPDLATTVSIGWPASAALPFPFPKAEGSQPADSPLGGSVSHGAWLIAMTQDAVGKDLLDAEIWDSTPPPPPTHEIAFSVELLEQIVTA